MPPSAAAALYPHLRSGIPNEVEHQRKPNVADALFPAWSREQKARDADQRLWDEICKRNRDILHRNLREDRRSDA
jgi:hypothetical protein